MFFLQKGVYDHGSIYFLEIITEQTERALWEVRSIIDSVPDELWEKNYCEMLIANAGIWPRVLGLEHPIPKDAANLDHNE